MSKPVAASGAASGSERRAHPRRPVLDSFSFSVAIPQKGEHRVSILDISEHGVGFCADIDGESHESFPIKTGDVFDIHLYLNQSLYLPLSIKVARLETRKGLRYIGGQVNAAPKALEAYHSLLQMLDLVVEAAEIKSKAV